MKISVYVPPILKKGPYWLRTKVTVTRVRLGSPLYDFCDISDGKLDNEDQFANDEDKVAQ